jgi:hypothetical protein
LLVVPALYALWFRVRRDEPARQHDDTGEALPAFDPRGEALPVAAE